MPTSSLQHHSTVTALSRDNVKARRSCVSPAILDGQRQVCGKLGSWGVWRQKLDTEDKRGWMVVDISSNWRLGSSTTLSRHSAPVVAPVILVLG
jgi:hypothetical protein